MRATQLARRTAAVAVLLMTVLAAACGGSAVPATEPTSTTGGGAAIPSPTATSRPSPSPTPTQAVATPGTPAGMVTVAALVAVGEAIFPAAPDGNAYIECSNGGNVYEACPITSRLKQRLQQVMVTLCRCQNPAATRTVTADVTATGGVIHVDYGSQRFDLIAVQQGGRLLVDDQRCRVGGPSTSIYSTVNPC
ncbi:MAG TPA: hypothetical protein VFN57_13510 [Thermomicrobiaceae bacterium]|nr:hypothetical protein [Thermomicrobiaceae bacterium]